MKCMTLAGGSLLALAYASGAAAQATSPPLASQPGAPAGVAPADTGSAPTPADTSSQLTEVVVTAQKRSENLQRTPISITALSPQALQAIGAQSVLDLNTRVPNLFVGGAGAAGRAAGTFFIRGIGVDSDTLAKEPGVGLYIDDFYYGHTAGSLLSVLDVESIEVLRGPQGTLFGKNTIGGAVRYTSVKPSFTPEYTVEGNLGSFSRTDIKASANVPITDELAARLSVASLNEDGYVHDIPLNKDLGDDHNNAIRAQLRFKHDRFDADFSIDYIDSHNNGGPSHLDIIAPTATSSATLYNKIVSGQAPVPFYSAQVYAGLTAPSAIYDSRYLTGKYDTYATRVGYKLTGFGVNLTAAYHLTDDLTIKSLTGYRRNEVYYQIDNDQSPLNFNGNTIREELPSISQEIQVLGTALKERLHYIGGFYYYYEDPHSQNDRGFPGEADGNMQLDDILTTSKALFTQFDYDIIPKVKLTLGARYSDDTKDATSLRTRVLLNAAGLAGTPEGSTAAGFVPTTATNFGPISGHGEKDFYNFSPKAGLSVQWTSDFMTYFTASKGYRAGGFNNGIAVFNPTTGANPNNGVLPFQNETDISYEGGFRAEFLDHHIRLNMSGFYSDYTNLQISSSQITGVGSASFIKIDNVAKARLDGAEGEFTWRVLPSLTLGANAGWLEAKYLQIAPTVTAITTSSRLAGAPKTTYSLYATYDPRFADGSDIAFNLNWGHQSVVSTFTAAATAVLLPSYGLLNGSVFYTFADRKLSVGLTVKNMLNQYYRLTGTSMLSVPSGNGGFQYSTLGRPAEAYVTAKYKF